MILKIFAIRDIKTETLSRPYFMNTPSEAIRFFMDLCADPQTLINKHPDDFKLLQIGDFNDNDGVINSHPPVHLASATDFLNQVPQKMETAK